MGIAKSHAILINIRLGPGDPQVDQTFFLDRRSHVRLLGFLCQSLESVCCICTPNIDHKWSKVEFRVISGHKWTKTKKH